MTLLDRARQLVRLAALSEHEEEARTAAVAACRLIVKEKIRLSTEERPDDTAGLSELEEAAREAIERVRKKREALGMHPNQSVEGEQIVPGGMATPPKEAWMNDLLFSASFNTEEKCRMLGCRGNKPCASCESFTRDVVRRAVETEFRGLIYSPHVRAVAVDAIVGYLRRAWDRVKRTKREIPKERRLKGGKLRIIREGKS